ncbi:hypothetical protein [Aurantimonas sp. VKM B-3413]|uniref:hypothetical protein n=1 Tax=Aurantimonas sp. VKM B-3413 TaxID=2779401 RepID=UPI001E2CA731|nr:hypothetical protein [Aurantimonas sp. VKM B-3413]MCB8837090.1 hypothetical protein [Aurantimonas sp. VKM B-3413]
MSRMASTLALSVWGGFCGFASLRLLHEGGVLTELLGPVADRPFAWMAVPMLGVDRPEAVAFAAILAALAIGLVMAVTSLHSRAGTGGKTGEAIAAAALCALFAFFAATSLAGSPATRLFADGPSFTLWLALSFGALLFDHLMAEEEDPEDEASFRAILHAIDESERDAIARRDASARGGDRDLH